ncbi:hypothetical protein CWE15_00230 [Aliidiomarina taiwanensis]|uniref:Uncharacterized protein n=1 Tax=Aliidiomarina taiwanensis TaxID=946228 RepID=A0A432X8C4_9GAMM|nr:hypothetical protein [Aliidiomarina taiwanensis]RUO43665.1 hypothetical protein CWE15_00230 [Aliidiomarina taiwanensis]
MKFIIVVALILVVVLVYRAVQASKAQGQSQAPNTPADLAATEDNTVAVEPKADLDTQEAPAAPEPETAPSFDVPEALEENAAALADETDALSRHRLLSNLTETSYKNRKDQAFRAACHYFSAQHVAEFEQIAAPLKQHNRGKLPQVLTFQNYANLLLEDKRFDEAIAVCRQAISFGLDDKTQTGFEGRIARIEARRDKS